MHTLRRTRHVWTARALHNQPSLPLAGPLTRITAPGGAILGISGTICLRWARASSVFTCVYVYSLCSLLFLCTRVFHWSRSFAQVVLCKMCIALTSSVVLQFETICLAFAPHHTDPFATSRPFVMYPCKSSWKMY